MLFVVCCCGLLMLLLVGCCLLLVCSLRVVFVFCCVFDVWYVGFGVCGCVLRVVV